MFTTVIFDLDGVIIDSEPIHQSLETRLFQELRINVDRCFHQKLVGMNEDLLWGTVIKAFNLDINPRVMIERKRSYLKSYLEKEIDLTPVKGVLPCIRMLKRKGYSLAVASSSPLFYIDAVLKRFNINPLFTVWISGEEIKHSKPAPDIFIQTARRMHKQVQECCVIEDSTNGIKAAKAAGMKVIGFKNRQTGSQDLSQADYVINTFSRLDRVLKHLSE